MTARYHAAQRSLDAADVALLVKLREPSLAGRWWRREDDGPDARRNASRLVWLARRGLIAQRAPDGVPRRPSFALTRSGRELIALLVETGYRPAAKSESVARKNAARVRLATRLVADVGPPVGGR